MSYEAYDYDFDMGLLDDNHTWMRSNGDPVSPQLPCASLHCRQVPTGGACFPATPPLRKTTINVTFFILRIAICVAGPSAVCNVAGAGRSHTSFSFAPL
jgi:hypothetical protein